MREKLCSIADAEMVVIKVSSENREALRFGEQLRMKELKIDDPKQVMNSRIVNDLLNAGMNALKRRKK